MPKYRTPSFRPPRLGGCVLWLRADLGLYTDAAKATPAVNDGDAVYTWADQSGNSNDVVQATAASRPLLKLAIQNGKPALRFDGSDDSFSSTMASTQPYTVFLFGKNTAGASNQYYLDGWVENQGVLSNIAQNNVIGIYAGATVSRAATSGAYQIYTAVFNGASSLVATNGTSTSGNVGATNTTGLRIGKSSGAGTALNGDIGEIIMYNRSLSTSEILRVENYLNRKYLVY